MHSQTQTLSKATFNGSRSHTRQQLLAHKADVTRRAAQARRKVQEEKARDAAFIAQLELEQFETDYRLGYGGFSGGVA